MKSKTIYMLMCLLCIALITLPTITAIKSKPLQDPWGFVRVPEFWIKYTEVCDNTSMENITWSGGAAIQYTVWGIGKHNIRCILDYEVYVFIPGGIQLVTGTITQDDSIYLFDMNQHPIIKPKVTNGTAILFYLYKEGFFHLKLIIDDRLVKEINYTYSHH